MVDARNQKPLESFLNIVDLAGSERRSGTDHKSSIEVMTPRADNHSPVNNQRHSINDGDLKGLRRHHAASMYSKRDNSRPRHTESSKSFILSSGIRHKESPRTTMIDKTGHSNSQAGGLKMQDLETEAKFINKNLTTLGRIFSILSNWRNEQ